MGNDFSVLMLVYAGDRPEHFDLALRSITGQTLKPAEIVLMVNGSIPEETEAVIRKYMLTSDASKAELVVIRSPRNLEVGEARRICFEHCRFPLIAIMDADDLSVSDRFEKQVQYFEDHPELSVVGGWIDEFVSAEDPTDISAKAGSRIVPEKDTEIREYMKKRCPMNQVTVMMKKEDAANAGGYIHWDGEEDYYLWVRMALAGCKFGNIPENLVNVRVGEEMYRRRGGIRYFKGEKRLQKFMLRNGIISFSRYCMNVGERFILQVLMPNKLRGFLFRKLARSSQ